MSALQCTYLVMMMTEHLFIIYLSSPAGRRALYLPIRHPIPNILSISTRMSKIKERVSCEARGRVEGTGGDPSKHLRRLALEGREAGPSLLGKDMATRMRVAAARNVIM